MSSSEVRSAADPLEKPLCFNLPRRTRLQMSGADRVKFLHNLSTAEIKKLPPGQGCETFIPTLQGRILGHFFALPTDNSILLTGVSNQAETLLPHFQKYAVIEDVEVVDRTADTSEYLLVGPHAATWIEQTWGIAPPETNLQIVADDDVTIYRTPYVGHSAWGVIASGENQAAPADALAALPQGTEEALSALRIEAGFPYFGRDITSENLAQEADRDAAAISFTKGCYLGQETIARIDALGHVNRRLLGVKFAAKPSDEATFEIDGKSALNVTSIAFSQDQDQWIGLAMVRRGFDKPGQTWETSNGPVEITALPFSSKK
ncbi:CAF17-like 4Fe-4S cluster assembly/insertion protein YgfZ [Blastopirellula marina]|uniref:Aminomethyltransferase folate-binding domain-containing protein n=1 Tax=Blastopirellula marina DSM 3645 TaxID=314230 RepID=A4A024_9BACT|nr:glycine cleavage T C-terminal barrel domain-containing protein [Blastopirellula marina]EAQ77819.1 hypothetical protein DSM3645_05944 [Blastopirellula marina DSM 3645]